MLSQKSRAGLLLSLEAVIPIAILMAISFFHYTANRYTFIIVGSWVILAAIAAVELFRQSQKQTKLLAIGVLIILLGDPLSVNLFYYRFQNGNRDNWKGAFELIKTQEQPGDVVVTINPELADYYMQDQTIPYRKFDLSTITERTSRVWFVEDMTARDFYSKTISWLEQNARLMGNLGIYVQARNFKMRVYLFEPEKSEVDQVLKD